MKKVLLALAVLSLVGSVAADEADLFGGVLIAHYPPGQVFSAGNDWCERYADTFAITDAGDQVTRCDEVSAPGAVWYVIAAFNEDKVWCGTQFGLGDYNPDVWYMATGGSGNCLVNSLEIPAGAWPGPNSGMSVAATTDQWVGNYLPIYYFEGYTYLASTGDMTPTVIPVTVDPSQDFIGFGNCEAPAGVWAAEGGSLGFFTDGVDVFPQVPAPPSACCDEFGACTMLLPADCIDAGGVPFEGEDCATFVCEVLVVACCFDDGSCVIMLPDNCDANGGTVMGDSCDPNPCPQPEGACCIEEVCSITTEIDCAGEWQGMDTVCDPNPCDIPSASDDNSWGAIKTMYR